MMGQRRRCRRPQADLNNAIDGASTVVVFEFHLLLFPPFGGQDGFIAIFFPVVAFREVRTNIITIAFATFFSVICD